MEPLTPRSVRLVPPPLGVYFRPGYVHHQAVDEVVASGVADTFRGVVFEASNDARQTELLTATLERDMEAVFDPEVMELATPGGFARLRARRTRRILWAEGLEVAHSPASLATHDARSALVDMIVSHVRRRHFTAVLAPTHFLVEGHQDSWFPVDREMTQLLRERLDADGGHDVVIYYPLAIPNRLFLDNGHRASLRTALFSLPIDAIWLRLSPFGGGSGPTTVRRVIEACPDFHHATRPLVAERVGVEGLAMLAFGAVGAVGGGITSGENFDASARLLRPPRPLNGRHFGLAQRVYLAELEAYLPAEKAKAFFESRGMKALCACKDDSCCRHGCEDMLSQPRRHFIKQRLAEVKALSRIPEDIRAQRYLQDFLGSATAKMLRAAKIEPCLESPRRRLEGLRLVLCDLERKKPSSSFSAVPRGRRLEMKKGA